jgi:hypothetical protein
MRTMLPPRCSWTSSEKSQEPCQWAVGFEHYNTERSRNLLSVGCHPVRTTANSGGGGSLEVIVKSLMLASQPDLAADR